MKIPFAGFGIDEELDRAGVVIASGAGEFHGRLGQRRADRRIERDRGRNLDHLLMAALHRAIALVEVQDVAVLVAEDLDFDVAGAANKSFQEYRVVAERGSGFAAGFLELSGKLSGLSTTRMPRPPPPKAALMMSGKPISAASSPHVSASVTGSSVPGTTGMPAFWAKSARRSLVAQQFEQLRAGADEGDARAFTGPRQRRILGQKTIARMDRIDALFLRQRDDAFDVKVGFDRALACADQVGFIRLEAVQGEAVFLRINGDRAQTKFVGGAKNANGNFAAIEC